MRNGARIGELADAAGVSVQTIRYYERLGLLPRPERTPAGYRVFAGDAAARLRFVKQAQALGFSLEEIKEILRLRFVGQSPCECVRGMLQEKLERVERDLAALARFRRTLRQTLRRAQKLPRLPHTASTICPIIQVQASQQSKTRGE